MSHIITTKVYIKYMDSNIEQLLTDIADSIERYHGGKNVYTRTVKGGIEVKCEIQEQKLHGVCTISCPHTGNKRKHKITCEYTNGLRNGKYIEDYIEDYTEKYNNTYSTHIVCTYADDVLHGKYEKKQNNIVLLCCSYTYGEKYGSYLQNFDNGVSKIKCYYRHNKLSGEYIENHPNGTPYVKCKYHNGMKQGEYMQFYENGFLSVYCSNYIEDKKHGVYATFNKEGNPDTEGSYENDVKQGMHRDYYYNWGIVQEETYKDASSKTLDDR